MALFEAIKLHKRFGNRVVLEDISLAFEEGQVSGIMGPNGAGKTTCFNVLTGRFAPDRGQVLFKGSDIAGLQPQKIAQLGVARSFQTINLFDDSSVMENVAIALPEFRVRRCRFGSSVLDASDIVDRAREVLGLVGLCGREHERSMSLSYGDRRALEIAVALASGPEILFLDEPTAGLGAEATQNLARLIKKLRQSYTIVIIEHDMQFLFGLADDIYVIHWGQVIANGAPSDLRANRWVARSALGALD
jgi:branched-chain amino acid transport system ATP-binding protein